MNRILEGVLLLAALGTVTAMAESMLPKDPIFCMARIAIGILYLSELMQGIVVIFM